MDLWEYQVKDFDLNPAHNDINPHDFITIRA